MQKIVEKLVTIFRKHLKEINSKPKSEEFTDFYNNVEESLQKLVDADDKLETLNKYDWDNINEI